MTDSGRFSIIPAPINHEENTYFFHDWLVDAIVGDIASPRDQKLWLTQAYCRQWISVDQVAAMVHRYCLESA